MRGNFEVDEQQYPFLVDHVGLDEIHITDALTGESLCRQPLRGEFGSAERQAQLDALRDEALRQCRLRREANAAKAQQPAVA